MVEEKNDKSIFEAAVENFLGPIIPYLRDEAITEVLINGHENIFIEQKGKLTKVDAKFNSEDDVRAAVNNIAQSVGGVINDENPTLDARLPSGYRIHAVIPPCARNGTTVAIRKFSKTSYTMKDFVKFGAITPDAAQFLDICVFLGKNMLVSGGTGSGKTTLLGMLANRIPKTQRLIVIEDSSELKIDHEHVVFFETRMASDGVKEVSIRDLLKSSLRLRPDRIVVREVRGAEALELISAMNTGHKGCMGTIHANSAHDSVIRLQSLAQFADAKISETAIVSQIASAIDIIVQTSRFSDGSRKIQSIAEVRGINPDKTYNIVPIYEIGNLQRQADGKLIGGIEPTGEIPSFMEEIESNRIPFGKNKFTDRKAA